MNQPPNFTIQPKLFVTLLTQTAAVFTVFYALSALSLFIASQPDSFTIIWYANLATGLLLSQQPYKHWPFLIFGFAVANTFVGLTYETTIEHSLLLLPANLVDILIIAYFVKRYSKGVTSLDSVPQFVRLSGTVCFIPPLISAFLGSTALTYTGVNDLNTAWLNWYSGTVLGAVTIFPLAYALLNFPIKDVIQRGLEPAALTSVGLSLVVTVVAFSGLPYPFVYLGASLAFAAIFSNFIGLSIATAGCGILLSLLVSFGVYDPKTTESPHPALFFYLPLLLAIIPAILLSVATRSQRRGYDALLKTKEYYAKLYEQTPAAMHSVNSEERVTAVSDTWLNMLGYERHHVIDQTCHFLFTPDSAKKIETVYKPEFLANGRCDNVPLQMVKRNGQTLDVELSAIFNRHEDEDDWQTLAVIKDMSSEVALHDALANEKRLLEVTLMSIGDGVIATDINDHITFINPIAEAILGINNAAAVGQNFSQTIHLLDKESGTAISSPVQRAIKIKEDSETTSISILTNQEGQVFSIKESISPIADTDGTLFGAIMVFQDITDSLAATERMSYLAQHDALTELPNRVLLMDRLERACSKYDRYEHEFSLMFIDLDNFKTINDTLGHDQGDLLLQTIAQRLVEHCRDTDTVCRLGGDEFVLLLDAMSDPHNLSRFAEKIIAEISRPLTLCGTQYQVTASLGIAICPRDGVTPDALMRHADTAMYESKNQGRNNFYFYDCEMEAEVERRLVLEQMLHQGIDQREFKLAYQPIVDAQTESQIYVEALCRWNHKGQDIKPSEFITVAEDTRLIREIGLDLIRLACKELNSYQEKHGESLIISINISAIQLLAGGFVDQVAQIFKEYGVPPHSFVFEVTESSVSSNLELCLNTLHKLKALGLHISLDDFGTGHASLSHLKRFPIDILKIDREFIKDLEFDSQNKIFVNGILQLAHALNLTVVAEGVENIAQANLLREMGCDQLQGVYFAPPRPLEELDETEVQPHDKNKSTGQLRLT